MTGTYGKPRRAEMSWVLWSWPWSRHRVLRFVLIARAHGLTVDTEDDGGWLLRAHRITATGHDAALKRFRCVCRRLDDPGGRRRQRHNEILRRLRTLKEHP